jgi:hypothetical protein
MLLAWLCAFLIGGIPQSNPNLDHKIKKEKEFWENYRDLFKIDFDGNV